MPIPAEPKIYHIVHVDRLPAIIAEDRLWCDAEVTRRVPSGTSIGMGNIKMRRLKELTLTNYPGLHVGDCVPFYFCPRSVMLFLLHKKNPQLTYCGGQEPIIHLEADLQQTVAWADKNNQRWVFTLSNAGTYYFDDYCNLNQLTKINWNAVQSGQWGNSELKEGKQAEFLIEHEFSWQLVSRIGVFSSKIHNQVRTVLQSATHQPLIETKPDWYY